MIEISTKIFEGYVELYENDELLCTIDTIRFSQESDSYRKAVIALMRDKITIEREGLTQLKEIIENRGEGRWTITN